MCELVGGKCERIPAVESTVPYGSASPVGCCVSDIDSARRLLCVVGSRIPIRLGVAWASSAIGLKCGSASLGRRLSMDRVDSDGFRWILKDSEGT